MARIAGLLLLAAAAAFGQAQTSTAVSGAVQTRTAGGQFSAGFPGPGRFAPPAVQGMPYSAEEIQERQQTLSDGTHIQQTMSNRKMYRDAQGRTRTERPMMMRLDGQAGPVIVEITDPVAGVQYTLDTQNKVAHRVALQPFPSGGGRGGRLGAAMPVPPLVATATAVAGPTVAAINSVPAPPPPPVTGVLGDALTIGGRTVGPPIRPTIEKLGTQVIEGVLAEGQRQTMTIPAGSQGNDRDIHVITETWMSVDLKMAVYHKMSDPRSGDNVTRLTNVSRNDPDAQLFQPPADYQVVDETGPFNIHFQQ
ncbi:MAG TPA: hypothetical protein VGF16_00985 [Bryobacteraceae bacterium]|jgi:hypothetical protein